MYPECDRMVEAAKETQPAGDFIEWLREEKHVSLMVWGSWQDLDPCTNMACEKGYIHFGHDNNRPCPRCEGTGLITVDREGYVHLGVPLDQLLAQWKAIDLVKVEAERRTMLEALRAGAGA